MFTLIFRAALTYILLTAFIRLMGKRQIGELELSEFVVTMLLSELAAISVSDPSIPFLYSILTILLMFSLEMLLSFFSLKSLRFKRAIGGDPQIIIDHGRIDRKELEKARLSLDELLTQLRLKDVSDVREIEYGILEDNGQLSVMKMPDAKEITRKDMGLENGSGMLHALIIDGKVSHFNLSLINKDEKWLESELASRGEKTERVFLFASDGNGNSVFQKKTGDTGSLK